jgi:hypothetical protein
MINIALEFQCVKDQYLASTWYTDELSLCYQFKYLNTWVSFLCLAVSGASYTIRTRFHRGALQIPLRRQLQLLQW